MSADLPRVIVTGGGRGIGRAIVEAFESVGAAVAVLDLDPGDAGEVAIGVDISDFSATTAAVDAAVASLGGVDVLVCCAGINRDRIIWKMTEDEWDQVIDVDLKGVFNAARAVAPRLKAQGSGRVVTIASINGLRGKLGQVNYSAAKAGVIGMTKALARDLGRYGVTANCVCPGLVMTDMVAAAPPEIVDRARAEMVLPEPPEPADVAAAVTFLASPAARCITGEVIRVDSGQYI